jgi:hypothetical protein
MATTAWLKNSTGATIAKGSIVKADPAVNDSIVLTAAGDTNVVGVVEAAILAGQYGTIVLAGQAEVLVDNAVVKGNWVNASLTTPGQATGSASPGMSVIGSASRDGGPGALVWCEIHLSADFEPANTIPLAVENVTDQVAPVLVGGISFNKAGYPGATFRFLAVGAVDDAAHTGTVQLYDLTNMAEVNHQHFTSATPAAVTSAALALPAGAAILEVRIWVDAGSITLTSAWLEVSW